MSRFLMFKTRRRVAHSIVTSQWYSHLNTRKCGVIVTTGLRFPQYKLDAIYGFHLKRHGLFPSCNIKSYGTISRKFSQLPASSVVAHHTQVAWKRICQKYCSSGRTCSSIDTVAQTISLALTRSHLIVFAVFSFTCGEVAWAQRTYANPYHYPYQSSLYARAQETHAYITSLLFSALEGFILLIRAFYLAILFSPSIFMAPFADSMGPQFRKMWLAVVHRSLEKAGPAFIKWGQWAATRPDLFPRDLCTKLSELHSKAPEHSFSYTKKAIERAFGRKLYEIFDNFDEKPVASGSIAQVHRASLRFRYPGQQIKPMVVAVKTLQGKLVTSRFIYNFRRWKDVSFPKPVYPLVHPAVLVETYEQGECVSHFVDELEGHDRLKSALAHIGTHALLKMLLVDNFVHADMHPGNILVRVAHSKSPQKRLFKSKPHVIFLDVGMTAELSGSDQINLLEFFKAVARRDGRSVAEHTLRLSKQQNCPDPKAFIEEVDEAFAFWATPEGDLVHPAEAMQQLLEKVRRHRVNIDGNICTVMVTTLVLEEWQRKLDPAYNVMQTLQTLLLRADWAQSLSYTIEGLMAP